MNDKTAKRIRRTVRQMLEGSGLPDRQLLVNTKTGVVINNLKSFRGLYRFYKKETRNGTDLARVAGTLGG